MMAAQISLTASELFTVDHEHQADKHADGQGGSQEPVSDFAPLGVDAIHYVAHNDVSGAVDEHAN